MLRKMINYATLLMIMIALFIARLTDDYSSMIFPICWLGFNCIMFNLILKLRKEV